MKTMQQYWVTKKSVSRKFGGKEDECIISSDAELDAKLELFRSISESCIHLQKVIDIYQERLCCLAQEENALGRYLKECGKNEKNSTAAQIMSVSGKALAYSGHQRLTIRPPLVRLHHEVETFRGRAVSDTRVTVLEMEKARTEYRAALSWMKSASSQLDPDTGYGLEKFRKAQAYVRSTKVRFDRLMLACLQKVDLLAAARCNMFSHALIGYQDTISIYSEKLFQSFDLAITKLSQQSASLAEATTIGEDDKDKNTFFNAEYTDDKPTGEVEKSPKQEDDDENVSDLLGESFFNINTEQTTEESTNESELSGLNWPMSTTTSDFIQQNFMPSQLLQADFDPAMIKENDKEDSEMPKKDDKKLSQMNWLSLFAELDPLAQDESATSGDRA
ncbi:PREDICTED: islet cell autoantigen 1 [Nicrophorus vespilloides]|uniref:Islet cell autoantigen 1 n=1 Tax=Nicrophorus vespilloides TaxID=110193 RepID=A0ABM1MCS5_NICVS|nr:PREDICTED: islet cell autoantigen 1 [Nicrophorus vespilloides]